MTSYALNQTIEQTGGGLLLSLTSWLRAHLAGKTKGDVKPEDQQALLLEMMLSNPEAFRTESDFRTMAYWVSGRGW